MRGFCSPECPGAFLDKKGGLADFCEPHLFSFCKWLLQTMPAQGMVLYIASPECVTLYSKIGGLYGVVTFPNVLNAKNRAKFDFTRKLVGPSTLHAAAKHAVFCCAQHDASVSYITEQAPHPGSTPCTPPLESVIVRSVGGKQRELDWDVVRRYLPACTLSVVFQQTHNPDPTLPQAGVSTLYEWATHRRPASSMLWTLAVA